MLSIFHWVSHHSITGRNHFSTYWHVRECLLAVAMGSCQILRSIGAVLGAFQFWIRDPIHNSWARETGLNLWPNPRQKPLFFPFPFLQCFIALKYECLCPLILRCLYIGFKLWFLRWKGQCFIHSATHWWRLTESSTRHLDPVRPRAPERSFFFSLPFTLPAAEEDGPVFWEWGRVLIGCVLTASDPWS